MPDKKKKKDLEKKPAKKPAKQKPPKCPSGCGPHPKEDEWVFINPDGSAAWGPRTANCPRVIMVVANKHVQQRGAKCDPKYDYRSLINDARTRVTNFVRRTGCPRNCPYLEEYPIPGVGLHVETSCSPLAGGRGVIYTAHVRGYYVCTRVQE